MMTISLPMGWIRTELQNVCLQITDGTHKTPKYVNSGIRFISIKNIRPYQPINWDSYVKYITPQEHEELIKRCKPEKDDILFPRIGTLGFAKIIDFDEEVSIFVGLGLLKPNKKVILPRFLEHWMNSPEIYHLSHERATGTGRMTLALKESKRLPVVLPPFNEQKRIAQKVESLQAKSKKAKQALETAKPLLDKLRQSILTSAFRGDLTTHWRENNPNLEPASVLLDRIRLERRKKWEENELAKMSAKGKEPKNDKWKLKYNEPESIGAKDLPQLPYGWHWASFEQMLEYITSGSRGWAKFYSEDGALFIRAQNLKFDKLDLQDAAYVTLPEGAEGKRTKINVNDLLITITGANVTKTGLVVDDIGEAYVSQHVALCRLVEPLLINYIYFYIISASHGRKQLEEAAYGLGKPGLNLSNIKSVVIPIPSYKEALLIVQKIRSELNIADLIESKIEKCLNEIEPLDQSILKKAFLGELLPQIPTDEPAAELLKKIKDMKSK